jgi:NAD(P)-dependent dehydrogenase (short-subunit alcohol dehydrogenase family)
MTENHTLTGQTVVLIGGSAGIGRATAQLARAQGADVILTGRNAERLEAAAREVGAKTTAAFDVTDLAQLDAFFAGLDEPFDHLLLTGPGPYYAPLREIDLDRARADVDNHIVGQLHLARAAAPHMRPGGTLLFMGGTGGRKAEPGFAVIGAMTAALPALARVLAVELAPVRVNVLAAGFVDTPLSAQLLGDDLEARRRQLRDTLPIGRVVEPEDVAALAIHVMTNTALTGATFDIDGGQQLI